MRLRCLVLSVSGSDETDVWYCLFQADWGVWHCLFRADWGVWYCLFQADWGVWYCLFQAAVGSWLCHVGRPVKLETAKTLVSMTALSLLVAPSAFRQAWARTSVVCIGEL